MSGLPRTLAEIITKAIRNHLAEVHTALPGKVVRYDSAKQLADVQLQVKAAVWDEDNERTYEEIPILQEVPVCFMRGGGYFCSLPLQEGDFVLVIFSESSLQEWRATGQVSEPEGDARRHSIGWPVCYPACYPDNNPLAAGDDAARQNGLVIGRDGSSEQIRFANGVLELGVGTLQKVALEQKIDAWMQEIKNKFNSHTHPVPGVTPGPGSTTSSPTAASISDQGLTGSSLVKAKL